MDIKNTIDTEISKLICEMKIADSDGNISIYYTHPDFKEVFAGSAHLQDKDVGFYNEKYGTYLARKRAEINFLRAFAKKLYWDEGWVISDVSVISDKIRTIETELLFAEKGFEILSRAFVTEINALPPHEIWGLNK